MTTQAQHARVLDVNGHVDQSAPSPAETMKKKVVSETQTDNGAPDFYGPRPKTTWHLKPKYGLLEWLMSIDIGSPETYMKRPDLAVGEPPQHPAWRETVFITSWALAPLAFHELVSRFLLKDKPLPLSVAVVMYTLFFIGFMLNVVRRLHHYQAKYGVFDQAKRGRDMVSDRDYKRLALGVLFALFVRAFGPFLLRWDVQAQKSPLSQLRPVTPVLMGVWLIALDYFFYCYHRTCHQIDALWWVHRHHHTTKHPTPMQSILSEDVQEALEVIIIPCLATFTVPYVNFAELWMTGYFLIYVEVFGHSGIRAEFVHPFLGDILKPLGMELIVEDHDLHHRYGRSGQNYGKQTRIFDKIFGTISPRVECRPT